MAARHGGWAASAAWGALPLLACTLLSLPACSPQGGAGHPDRNDERSPRRVVVLAPAAAEMLEALALSDRVVGVGEFGPWPAPLDGLPRVGGYDTPSVERLLELNCDLVLTVRSAAARDAHRRLRSLGIRVVELETETHEGVFASLLGVGAIFDREAEAEKIHARLRADLAAIATAAAGLTPRRVLVVVGRDPLYVAGPGSHVDAIRWAFCVFEGLVRPRIL